MKRDNSDEIEEDDPLLDVVALEKDIEAIADGARRGLLTRKDMEALLDAMARSRQEEDGEPSFAKSYVKVLDTPIGKSVYRASRDAPVIAEINRGRKVFPRADDAPQDIAPRRLQLVPKPMGSLEPRELRDAKYTSATRFREPLNGLDPELINRQLAEERRIRAAWAAENGM